MSKYLLAILLLILETAWGHPTLPKHADNVTVTTCGGIINADFGIIDYYFPEGEIYPALADCIWTIRADPAKTHFEFYKPESDLHLGTVFVIVSSFTLKGGELIKQRAAFGVNTNAIEEKVVDGSVAIVVFCSTEYENPGHRGFRLQWSAIGADNTEVRNWFDFNTAELEGSLVYPPPGVRYNPYELSTFVISKNYTRNNGPRMTLAIDSHDLENSTGCSRDGLIVYQVNRGATPQVAMFCGTSNVPVALQPEYAYILVVYSDLSDEGTGFTAHWKLNPE